MVQGFLYTRSIRVFGRFAFAALYNVQINILLYLSFVYMALGTRPSRQRRPFWGFSRKRLFFLRFSYSNICCRSHALLTYGIDIYGESIDKLTRTTTTLHCCVVHNEQTTTEWNERNGRGFSDAFISHLCIIYTLSYTHHFYMSSPIPNSQRTQERKRIMWYEMDRGKGKSSSKKMEHILSCCCCWMFTEKRQTSFNRCTRNGLDNKATIKLNFLFLQSFY